MKQDCSLKNADASYQLSVYLVFWAELLPLR